MKKIAILVAEFYDDNELYYPYYRLQEAGFHVHLIGAIKGQTYKSKHGMIATSDFAANVVGPAVGSAPTVLPAVSPTATNSP